MIKINQRTSQIKVETVIKVIDKNGTEVIAPVTLVVDISKVENKHVGTIYNLTNTLFNKKFLLDRIKLAKKQDQPEPQPEPVVEPPVEHKKPWWKVW